MMTTMTLSSKLGSCLLFGSQVFQGHPVQDIDVPHILHSSKAVTAVPVCHTAEEVEPRLKKQQGWRDGYLRFPPIST